MAIISGEPYVDINNIREFDISKPQDEYVWHRDVENRIVEILEGQGWQFQFEECLPFLLVKGMKFKVPSMEYHRLIKGATPLKVRIQKI